MNNSTLAKGMIQLKPFMTAVLFVAAFVGNQTACAQTLPVALDTACYAFAGVWSDDESELCSPGLASLRLFGDFEQQLALRHKAGGCNIFSQSGFEVSSTYVLESDSTSGVHLWMEFGQIYTWDEWVALPESQTYRADYCDSDPPQHESWGYVLLETGTMQGFGEFDGWESTLSHQPSNAFYGGQIGIGASNYPDQLSFSTWFYHEGMQGNAEIMGSAILEALLIPIMSGCTYPDAANYNPEATEDDGSCTYPGCTDPAAVNYSALANSDDGSCMTCADLAICPEDINGDGSVTILDLLDVIIAFGTEVAPTALGCLDEGAFNFDPDANTDDGSCSYATSTCTGVDPVYFDGQYYSLVEINGHCWFQEDLNSQTYANGDPIQSPEVIDTLNWEEGIQIKYGYEGLGFTCFDSCDADVSGFGRLYNAHAIIDARGVCPTGWHVSSDEEWQELEHSLGMPLADLELLGERGTGQGTLLKATSENEPSWDGTDEVGFAALPNGLLGFTDYMASFNLGQEGFWWTPAVESTLPEVSRGIFSGSGTIFRYQITDSMYLNTWSWISVRCIQDEVGCTDADYLEFNPAARTDDGSCVTLMVSGCTDEEAENFNPLANLEDNSCTYDGSNCTLITYAGYTYDLVSIGDQCWFAENLRTTAYADGDPIPDNLSDAEWNSTQSGASAVYGSGNADCVGNCDETVNLAAYGRLYNGHAVNDARGLCPIGWRVPTDADWMNLELELGMPAEALEYVGWRGGPVGKQLKASPQDEPGWNGYDSDDPLNLGFSALPSGLRSYEGGFQNAGFFAHFWSSSLTSGSTNAWIRSLSGAPGDAVQRDVESLIVGNSVRCIQESGVAGCTDSSATNYDPMATTDDGSCTYDSSTCAPVTFDGYTYDVVEIGDQCWFAENLRTTHYRDDSEIPSGLTDAEWSATFQTSLGATSVYGEGNSSCTGTCDEAANFEDYGRLYNWYAVDDARGLCPTDWHVPTDAEWMTLEMELGMNLVEAYDGGWRGTDEGKRLKASPQGSPSWNGYDEGDSLNVGFSALPVGYRYYQGNFLNVGSAGYWWSASPSDGSHAWYRLLYSVLDDVSRNDNDQRNGFAVRCVRDGEVAGCTDSSATNYDPLATTDDCSCTYAIPGCTDSSATNYDSLATTDDGSCTYDSSFCTPVTYDGYTYDVVEIGDQCWFAENLRTTHYRDESEIPSGLADAEWSATDDTSLGATAVYGEGNSTCEDTLSDEVANLEDYGRFYNWYAVDDVRGLCPTGWHVPTDAEWMTLEMELGITLEEANGIGWRGTDEGKRLKVSPQGSPSWNGYDEGDSLNSGFSALPGGGRFSDGFFIDVGSYAFFWSTSPSGSNAWGRLLDSGYGDVYRGNFDLRYGFSVRCVRESEVAGCTDSSATNYDPMATTDDGSCASAIPGCTDSSATNYDPMATTDDGSCTYDSSACTPVTYDGYTYDVVEIGDQCWFAENLRTLHYRDDSEIPSGLTEAEWSATDDTSLGATAVYGEGNSPCYGVLCDEVANLEDYGRLYNWYAVDDARGLCPTDWHVPTDAEWMTLEMELGMPADVLEWTSWRGTDQGKRLKASPQASPSWNGYDEDDSLNAGFSALPGGLRSYNGTFPNEGNYAFFWSSSPSDSYAWSRSLYSGFDYVNRVNHIRRYGLSVRCVRDGEFAGCTDSSATNYDSLATTDDGSCTYAIPGCTDSSATNYDPLATTDDGSCTYDSSACTPVTYDGYTYDVVEIGDQCWFAENLRTLHYRDDSEIPSGLTDAEWSTTDDTNLGATAVYGEGNSPCYGVLCDEVANLEDYGRLYNWYAVDDARGLCPTDWHVPTDAEWMTLEMELGITLEEANNWGWRGTDEGKRLKASPQGSPSWNGYDQYDSLNAGFSALPGGYRSFIGSFSQVDNEAGFWSSSLSGSHAWVRSLSSGSDAVFRYDGPRRNGLYVRCVQGGDVAGCTDSSAMNYNPLATTHDGSCTYAIPGCTDSSATNYDPLATTDDGSCFYATSTCMGVGPVYYDGQYYSLVEIGDQCWFAENLRTTHYRDGSEIPSGLTDSEWIAAAATSLGASAVYGEGNSLCTGDCNEVTNLEDYGRLYNWYAVDDARGLCPTDWHVPTDAEWMTLEMELGMTLEEANQTGFRGTDEGKRLKASPQGSPSWNGYDEYDSLNAGFSALPGGRRYYNGDFNYVGSFAYFWSSSPSGSDAWSRVLHSGDGYVYRYSSYRRNGFSVRCVRDD